MLYLHDSSSIELGAEGMTSSSGVSLGQAKAKRFTSAAILVVLEDMDEEEEAWIPRSCIHDDSEVYDEDNKEGNLVVSAWLAKERGWG